MHLHGTICYQLIKHNLSKTEHVNTHKNTCVHITLETETDNKFSHRSTGVTFSLIIIKLLITSS